MNGLAEETPQQSLRDARTGETVDVLNGFGHFVNAPSAAPVLLYRTDGEARNEPTGKKSVVVDCER